VEGFSAPILSTPQCPEGYKFFNDRRGESFCCSGTINPYTHTCDAKDSNGICSFKPGVQDPRKTTPSGLAVCSDIIIKSHQESQSAFCPESLPNYVSKGKCCATGADLEGADCIADDNRDTRRYCIAKGVPAPGEQSCSQMQVSETTTCPTGLAKMPYTLGGRELAKYGGAMAKGSVNIPICFGMESSCIPDKAVDYAKANGAFTDKGDNWQYTCSNWKKLNIDRDLTGTYDKTYV